MITVDVLAALVAGIVGSIAMTAMMQAATAMGMTRMPPMPLIQGSMMTDDTTTATRIGVVTHIVMMGTVVFGLVVGLVYGAMAG